MATQKADNEKARKANRTALKGFEKAKVRKAFEAMSESRGSEQEHSESRANAALELCTLAHRFRAKQKESIPNDTIVEGWRENLKGVVMELAVAGNVFAEYVEATEGKAARAKLTGYGNNVASIAKGLIEFEIEPRDSYGDTRKAVQEAREAYRREQNPEEAELADARERADKAWTEVRKAVFGTSHVALITALAETLIDVKAELMAQPEAQGEGEAEAEPTEENTQPEDEDIAEAA